jgi:hypothetical protein
LIPISSTFGCLCIGMIQRPRRSLQVIISIAYMYALFVLSMLSSLLCRTDNTEELKKTHDPDTDLRSVPFDVNAVYHAGEGLPYGRYVESH